MLRIAVLSIAILDDQGLGGSVGVFSVGHRMTGALFLHFGQPQNLAVTAPWVNKMGQLASANCPIFYYSHNAKSLAVHRGQEFIVTLRMLHILAQEVEGFIRFHIRQVVPEDEHALERIAIKQQIFPTCA